MGPKRRFSKVKPFVAIMEDRAVDFLSFAQTIDSICANPERRW
jgi:hypothetical protein